MTEVKKKTVFVEVDIDHFRCPITKKFFRDPVIASDNQIYERVAIETYLQGKNPTSIYNKKRLTKKLIPLPWYCKQFMNRTIDAYKESTSGSDAIYKRASIRANKLSKKERDTAASIIASSDMIRRAKCRYVKKKNSIAVLLIQCKCRCFAAIKLAKRRIMAIKRIQNCFRNILTRRSWAQKIIALAWRHYKYRAGMAFLFGKNGQKNRFYIKQIRALFRELKEEKEKNMQYEFLECPITQTLPKYENLVYSRVDGRFYDGHAIRKWLSTRNESPCTRQKMDKSDILQWCDVSARIKFDINNNYKPGSTFAYNDPETGQIRCVFSKDYIDNQKKLTVQFMDPLPACMRYKGKVTLYKENGYFVFFWFNQFDYDTRKIRYPMHSLTVKIGNIPKERNYCVWVRGLGAMGKYVNDPTRGFSIGCCATKVENGKFYLYDANNENFKAIEINNFGDPLDKNKKIRYFPVHNLPWNGWGWNDLAKTDDVVCGSDGSVEILLELPFVKN